LLDRYLDEAGVVGISEIDTRALTRHIRDRGAMRGVISTLELDPKILVARAKKARSMLGLDLAREVTCAAAHRFHDPNNPGQSTRFKVLAYDFGLKRNILRMLSSSGCDVTIVPATTTSEEALQRDPDGIFFSNGPGDPEPCTYAIRAARELMRERPIFGICLGHQILGLACGGKTYKLKFGHRGANHPVRNLRTGQVEITAQNHGFALDSELFSNPEFELTHINLNDGTVEGFRHRDFPVYSVQYHPEASPGPHDSHYLFREFIDQMAARKGLAPRASRDPESEGSESPPGLPPAFASRLSTDDGA
jgi:carbamoyl-phosphate synthase small subunit